MCKGHSSTHYSTYCEYLTYVSCSSLYNSSITDVDKYNRVIHINEIINTTFNWNFHLWLCKIYFISKLYLKRHWGHRGPDRMVVEFTQHLPVQSVPSCDFKPRSWQVYSIQHYVINFVSDLLQVGGFLRVLCFPPPIKLTAKMWLKYCWKSINQPT